MSDISLDIGGGGRAELMFALCPLQKKLYANATVKFACEYLPMTMFSHV